MRRGFFEGFLRGNRSLYTFPRQYPAGAVAALVQAVRAKGRRQALEKTANGWFNVKMPLNQARGKGR